MSYNLRRLTESALLIAIGTVLSLFPFQGPWALGGGITVCAMLPLVMLSHRYGCKWGLLSALVYSLLQMLLGLNNVQIAPDPLTAVGIILLDYVVAFTVIGFASCFNGVVKDHRLAIVLGIAVTFFARFVCHFFSGLLIWEVLWPNSLHWTSWIWSLAYNGSFMLPETVLTSVAAFLLYKPLEKFWLGSDLPAKQSRMPEAK